uniref:Polycystin cation channel PKD1/PKD2 domain-containing protein n=1 Tax=Vitrella brassicaformis TaxID=1169539 RepID=A0A7S1JMP3_9ALVE|mmetsp:Transcript_14584/g.34767  ORF Transcript_14584/g.34767 Transcript_14584/m.34767 type:complete len:324 (+) Transcript_14584:2-973(+)
MIGGRIHSSIALHSCRLQPYRTGADFARLACEVFFFLCLCVYVLREMNELRVYKLEYFKSFWNLVELTNIAMYLTILVYWSRFLLEDRFQYLEFSPTEYRDPGKVIELFTFTSAVAAVNVIIGCFTIFKYLQVNPKLSLLWVALSNAAVDILPFIMVFFLVTIGFTFAGHWLFGTRVAGFHTWGESFSTLLRSLTGEYDYESLQLADSAAAPAYTVGWIFIVTLVLINMFIAILTDAFELTKDRIRRIADFQDQAGEGFMLRTALLDSVEGIARQFAEKENVDPDRKVHTKKLKRVRKEVFQNPQLLFVRTLPTQMRRTHVCL